MTWNTDPVSVVAFVLPSVVVPVGFAARNLLGSGRRQADRWAASERVVLTEATAEPVRRHLKRIRCARSLAALPLWWLAFVRAVNSDISPAVATAYPALIAYVLAGVIAGMTGAPLGTDPVARASLVPRTTSDYVPTWLRGLAMGTVVAAAALLVGPWPKATGSAPFPPTAGVALAVAAVMVAEGAVYRLVRRPQRSGDRDVLAADDALRAMAGSMVYDVALLAAFSSLVTSAGAALPDPPGWWALPVVVIGLTCGCLQFGILVGLVRQETWGFRRRHGVVTGTPGFTTGATATRLPA